MKKYAHAVSSLLGPMAATGYMFAAWRLGSDLDWTGEFFISDGLFSKWQVWLAVAAATQLAAHRLNQRAGRSDTAAGA